MKKLVGKYFLGLENIDVYLDPNTNNSFAQLPGNWRIQGEISKGFLTIGGNQPWGFVLGGLVHEAMEYLSVRFQTRYHADLRSHEGPSVGIILLTHDQFSEITDALGTFLAPCVPDLQKTFIELSRK